MATHSLYHQVRLAAFEAQEWRIHCYTVFIPSALSELNDFKDTINSLFMWRNFMRDQIKIVRKAKLKADLASVAVSRPQRRI